MSNIEPASAGLPTLYSPMASLDSNDVQIPAVKFGHPQSELCSEHGIKLGVIYAAAGKDDPDPQILWNPNAKGDNPGMVFHVLDMEKYKSKVVDGEVERYDFHDADAPEGCDTVYKYTIACLAGDTELPYRMSLYRTKANAARTINTHLVKNEGRGPAHHLAFEMTTKNKKVDGKGSWTVPQVRLVEATPAGIELASKLAAMIGSAGPATTPRSAEPAI